MRGVTVFRALLPPTLIADLRRVTDECRELARQGQFGGQTQRLQPVGAYDIDHKPFENYRDLPELREAIDGLLGREYSWGDLNVLGVLLEPAETPWWTEWHRDVRDNAPGFDPNEWSKAFPKKEFANQVNCPLYKDDCTWFVPGSHLRPDLPRERELFPSRPFQ